MSWKDYVPQDMREKSRDTFVTILKDEYLDVLLDRVAFQNNRHNYWNCESNQDECEDCYGDSTERDLREETKSFYTALWKSVINKLIFHTENDEAEDDEVASKSDL